MSFQRRMKQYARYQRRRQAQYLAQFPLDGPVARAHRAGKPHNPKFCWICQKERTS